MRATAVGGRVAPPAPDAGAQPGFIELPECLACVLFALPAHFEGVVRFVELPAQLRGGSTHEFQLGALFVAQLDAPIPRLIV
jgi:hypothetical protein